MWGEIGVLMRLFLPPSSMEVKPNRAHSFTSKFAIAHEKHPAISFQSARRRLLRQRHRLLRWQHDRLLLIHCSPSLSKFYSQHDIEKVSHHRTVRRRFGCYQFCGLSTTQHRVLRSKWLRERPDLWLLRGRPTARLLQNGVKSAFLPTKMAQTPKWVAAPFLFCLTPPINSSPPPHQISLRFHRMT